MGLFGGLFDKKACSVCGGDAGRVFTKKLEDGILCKECAGKLSPWFSDRRSSTVAQIEEQLAYREANKAEVEAFSVTRTLNGRTKVLLDENAGKFIVTSASKWRDGNPDVLSFADVTGCVFEVKENKRDVTPEPPKPREGEDRPTPPPIRPQDRIYEYDYDFYMTINVNNPYFDEIHFQVNDSDIKQQYSAAYNNCVALCEEIKAALTEVREQTRAAAEAEKAPKYASTCPHCGATTIPDANGRCEYCGGSMAS